MIPPLLILLAQDASQAASQGGGLEPFAWIFMLASITAVTSLTVWCFSRILRGREHFDPDGTGPRRPPVPGEFEQRDR